MNELIKITKQELNGEVVETSDARELYLKLQSKLKFSDWVKRRVKNRRFIEGKDYFSFLRNNNKRGQPRIEYALVINTSEHIALMEDNEIGDTIRQYYIDHRRESEKAIKALVEELEVKNNFLIRKNNRLIGDCTKAEKQAYTVFKDLIALKHRHRIDDVNAQYEKPNKDNRLRTEYQVASYRAPKSNAKNYHKPTDDYPSLPFKAIGE